MNCRELCKQIPSYMDGEVSPSEKALIQAHLADCPGCQNEFEALAVLRKDLRHHLKVQAASVAPLPQAWTELVAALDDTVQPQPTFSKLIQTFSNARHLYLGRWTARRLAAALLVVIAMVVIAPPVWARLEPIITNWFSFTSPDGKSEGAIGGFTAFTPFHATYLPDGFQQSLLGSSTSPDLESLELGYDKKEKFVILVQSKEANIAALPEGEDVRVLSYPASFMPSFATSLEEFQKERPTISTVTEFDYSNTNLLTWFLGEIRIEMFSNLTKEEMIKVAESLEPMQITEGEWPNPDHE
jgi:hypothetical protein